MSAFGRKADITIGHVNVEFKGDFRPGADIPQFVTLLTFLHSNPDYIRRGIRFVAALSNIGGEVGVA